MRSKKLKHFTSSQGLEIMYSFYFTALEWDRLVITLCSPVSATLAVSDLYLGSEDIFGEWWHLGLTLWHTFKAVGGLRLGFQLQVTIRFGLGLDIKLLCLEECIILKVSSQRRKYKLVCTVCVWEGQRVFYQTVLIKNNHICPCTAFWVVWETAV